MTEMDPTGAISPVPPEAVEQKVRQFVAKALDLDVDEVQLSSTLMGELGAESLDLLDIAFMVEREFRIEFPRTDIIERATAHFGEEALVVDNRVTDLGLELLRKGMPEIDQSQLKQGMLAIDVARLATVQTFVRVTSRLLEVKAQFPRECPDCGATMHESDVMPEFVCAQCGKIQPLPGGDEILLRDMIEMAGGVGVTVPSADPAKEESR